MNDSVRRRDFLAQSGLLAGAAYLWPVLASAEKSSLGINRHYASNRAPLLATPYVSLPLGSIKPAGWLRTQLELQRDGLTGHAEELLPALQPDSGWLGGPGEDWEKGPYYVKGLIPLAAALDDPTLWKKASKWVEWMLGSQREDGFFGPKKNDDWWPRMVVTYLLRDYHEATGDPRVLTFLSRYYAHLAKELPGRPLRDWGRARAGDEMDTVFWLYNRTGEAGLLSVADLLRQQAFDWTGIFTENDFLNNPGGEKVSHNVNVPQALKMPAVAYQRTGRAEDRAAVQAGLDNLARDHGQAIGIEAGTEHLSGRSPTEGVETCSTVEKMLSLETNLRVLGDAALGDALEKLAFNALPGALSTPIKQLVYYTRANNVTARLKLSGYWQDYADGSVPGPMSGYPCCCYNFHMGWPKYLQNSWAATHDQGLAVLAYGPSEVKAKVGEGVEVVITETTDYPFGESIHLHVTTPQSVAFPLELRIPGWCRQPSIKVAGEAMAGAKAGEFFRVARTWSSGDEVILEFPMPLQTTRGALETVSIEHGPLVFSLQVPEKKSVLKPQADGFDQYELLPESAWNYALALDPAHPEAGVSVQRSQMPRNPFVAAESPVKLQVRGRKLPEWKLAWNEAVAFDPPRSPVTSSEPEENLTLVPFGSEYLRVTNFPLLGQPGPAPASFADGFDSTHATAWTAYRGGWFVENGTFGCTAGQPGGKAVVAGTDFADFTYNAEVSVGPDGHGGLLFRAANFGAGLDDYSGYYVGLDAGHGAVLIGKGNGNWKELARAEKPMKPRQFYPVRVVARGPKIQIYVEDFAKPLLEISDSSFASGAIGLRHHLPKKETGYVRFDNVSVTAV